MSYRLLVLYICYESLPCSLTGHSPLSLLTHTSPIIMHALRAQQHLTC